MIYGEEASPSITPQNMSAAAAVGLSAVAVGLSAVAVGLSVVAGGLSVVADNLLQAWSNYDTKCSHNRGYSDRIARD